MSDAPRWQIMADLVERATAPDSGGDSGEFARLFEEFLATAEAIAEDAAAPAAQRVLAGKILARIDRAMRANTPALLAVLARVARDPDLTAEERARRSICWRAPTSTCRRLPVGGIDAGPLQKGWRSGFAAPPLARTFTPAEFVLCEPAFNASVMATHDG